MFRRSGIYLLKTLALLMASAGTTWLLGEQKYLFAALAGLFVLFLGYHWLSQERRLVAHLEAFTEAVHYRDFTRRYPSQIKDTNESRLFRSFNHINAIFRSINTEKERQHQYLNKVINMLDMGLIFYQADTGQVKWINDAFKQLFGIPHISQLSGLEKRSPELYRCTVDVASGQQQVVVVPVSTGRMKLLIQSAAFDTNEGSFRIVSYKNLSDTIDQTETKAWHKLLRVLTHEIMNSIAPITSLAETLHSKLEHYDDTEDILDVKIGIATIQNRSRGLLQFAKSYRQINQIEQPQFKSVTIFQLFDNIHQLMEPTLIKRKIQWDMVINHTRAVIRIDQSMIEQVILNIILNAMDAVDEATDPRITMQALEVEGRVQIRVIDNGRGIPQDILDEIFTPFFTTKKTGTGIGLTLSKHIMLLHGGNIFIDSEEGQGTTVRLQF